MDSNKLSKLVDFYKHRLDVLDSSDDFARGAYCAYSIAMMQTRELMWEEMNKEINADLLE